MNAFFISTAGFHINSRTELMKILQKENYNIICISPKTIIPQESIIKRNYINWRLDRCSINLFDELFAFLHLFRILRKYKSDLVHTYGHKANIYAGFAFLFLKSKNIICTLPGLGTLFGYDLSIKNKILKKVIIIGYKIINRHNFIKFIFVNEHQKSVFTNAGYVSPAKSYLIKSEGVDIDRFSYSKIDNRKVQKIKNKYNVLPVNQYIIMISRLFMEKGVSEFIQASKIIQKIRKDVKFILVGPIDKDKNCMTTVETINESQKNNEIIYLGERTDIREILSIADIVTLPTYYMEGVPCILLEASAMSKAIVTTNIPGCTELIKNNINGLICKKKDTLSLVKSLLELLNNKDKRQLLGENARKIVEKKYSGKRIAKNIRTFYNL